MAKKIAAPTPAAKKTRAPRKVRTLDERIADLAKKIGAHNRILAKLEDSRSALVSQRAEIAAKKLHEQQMQDELIEKTPAELEVALAEAEEAAKKIAMIRAAMKTKEAEAATIEEVTA